LTPDGDEWSGGEILDPDNEKPYSCYIHKMEETGQKLHVRGYIDFSLFGAEAKSWNALNDHGCPFIMVQTQSIVNPNNFVTIRHRIVILGATKNLCPARRPHG